MSHSSAAAALTTGLSCPHCSGVLPAGWSSGRAGRCPTCRLMIGAGRGRSARSAPPGSAANLLANRARRVSTENASLPTLEVVLATFSTWKAARAYGSRHDREVEG